MNCKLLPFEVIVKYNEDDDERPFNIEIGEGLTRGHLNQFEDILNECINILNDNKKVHSLHYNSDPNTNINALKIEQLKKILTEWFPSKELFKIFIEEIFKSFFDTNFITVKQASASNQHWGQTQLLSICEQIKTKTLRYITKE